MRNVILLALVILLLASCHSHDDHSHAADDPQMTGEAADQGDEVALTMEQINNIGLKYGQIEGRKIRSTVKLNGRVELPPSGKSISSSSLDGRIEKVLVTAGQYVRKGQALFSVQNLELVDWQKEWAQAKAREQFLVKETDRQKKLLDEAIAPAKNYEVLVAELQERRSTIKALETKLKVVGLQPQLDGNFQATFRVLAPAAGTIQHLLVSNGEYINANMPLAEIIDNSRLHLHLNAYGPDIKLLKEGQLIRFFVQSRPDQILEAKVFWINVLVNEESNSYDVHAKINNSTEGLSPGEFVEARVINQEQTLNTLPISAVTNDKGLQYVFVKEEEHDGEVHFLKLKVKTGEADLGFIAVEPVDPIPPGAEVVVEGAFFLMAESKKGEGGGGGHHHH